MRIAVVDPSLFTPFYDLEFCRALACLGDAVTMVGRPLREGERHSFRNIAYEDLFYRHTTKRNGGSSRSFRHKAGKGLEHASGLRSLENLVYSRDIDVVHFQWLVLPFLDRRTLARLRHRCGLVLTVHNSEIAAHDALSAVGRIGSLVQEIGRQQAICSFDRYIVHSERSRESLRALGVGTELILQMPHPPLVLEGPQATPEPKDRNARRNILFFGNIKPYKGVETLIEAGIALAASRRDFLITIAGKPSTSMGGWQTKIASAGATQAFRFDLDFLPEARLAHYIAAAEIVVFPYRDIDGSGALSHAVTFEKPIVASNVGGFAEPPFRNHLELVPPADPIALAAALGRLLDDPERLITLAAKSRALKAALPTWHSYARACREMYATLARRA